MMNRFMAATLICMSVVRTIGLAQERPFYLRDGDRVVFYGDSITEQRMYTMIVETYAMTRFPSLNATYVNSGWGGDRVSGGGGGPIDVRLQRDVIAYRPTVITVMLGMNDGGYKAPTEESDKAFFDGMRHIVDTVRKDDSSARITLIEPSPYDDVTRSPASPVASSYPYNNALIGYGNWIGNYGSQNGMTVADANTAFVEMLKRAFAANPETANRSCRITSIQRLEVT